MAKECVTKQAIEAEKQLATEQATKNLQQKFKWKSEVAGAVAGVFVAGNVANMIDEEDNSGWYQVAGMLLGAGAGRYKSNISQAMQGFTKKVGDHIPDNKLAMLFDYDKKFNKTRDMRNGGMNPPLGDDQELQWYQKTWDAIKQVGKDRNNMYEGVFKNRFVESMFSTLKRYNVKTANKLAQALQTIPNTVDWFKTMRALPFDEKYGSGSMRNYRTESLELVKQQAKQAGLGELSDKQAQELFDKSVSMILSGGGAIKDRQYSYIKKASRGNVVFEYKKNPKLEELHRRLLSDKEFKDYIDSHHTYNSKVEQEYKRHTYSKMDRILTRVQEQYPTTAPLLRELKNVYTNMTFAQYKNHLRKNDFQKYATLVNALKEYKHGNLSDLKEQVKLFAELNDGVQRFSGYQQSYFPQKHNFDKELQARRKWFAEQSQKDGEFEKLPEEKKIELWENKVSQDINAINNRKMGRKVQVFDENGHMVRVDEFDSRERAVSMLNGIIKDHMPNASDREFAQNNLDSLVVSKEVPATDESGNVLVKDGQEQTTKVYYIEAPKERPDLFGSFNRKEYREEIRWVRQGAIVNKSNHLEHSRETLLPYYLMDTNVDRVYNSYARDVGERIHMLRNDIFNENDLKQNYFNKIGGELKDAGLDQGTTQKYLARLGGIYNTTTNAVRHQDPAEYEKLIKRNQLVNTYSDLLGSAYGYGISFYNSFEWAVLAPLISSWGSVGNTAKTFALNRKTANSWTEILKEVHILDNHLQFLDATIADDIPNAVNSSRDVLDTMAKGSRKMHKVAADFSFTKMAGRMIGWDVENAGVWRIFIDGFQGGNEAATAINARSALYETRKLAQVYRKLQQSGEQVVKFDGKQWNVSRIKRQLERYGITENKVEDWVENFDKIDNLITRIDKGESIATILKDPNNATAAQLSIDVMQSATHTMHGTNKFLRPEFASTPLGRMAYKYQTYPFNFAFQNVKERIVRPLREFRNKHLITPDGKDRKVDMSLAKIYYNYKRQNFDKLKKAGFSDKAIEDMPIEVYEHVLKLLTSVFGISVAGNMALGTISDIVEYPVAEALDQETFWRTKQNMILNPTSPKDEQMTIKDFFDKPSFDGVANMLWYAMGQGYQSGVAGAYGNLLENRYDSDKGLLDLTMLGSDANDIFRTIRKTSTAGIYDWAPTLTEEMTRLIESKLPLVSSRPFSGIKSMTLNKLFNDEKTKKGLTSYNSFSSLEDNGEIIDFQY